MSNKKDLGQKARIDRFYKKNRGRTVGKMHARYELKRAGYGAVINTGVFGSVRLQKTVVMVIPNKFAGTKAVKLVVYGVSSDTVMKRIRTALRSFGRPGTDIKSVLDLR